MCPSPCSRSVSLALQVLFFAAAHARWTSTSYSVMTGRESVYGPGSTNGGVKLPDTLRTRYKHPESYHPNLRFWFTPDSFESVSTADDAVVSTWTNVANICYNGHPSSAECTSAKILTGDNMAVEALKQSTFESRPMYKREVLNGRGIVRFTRNTTDGSAGDFLQMETTSSSNTAGFTTNPFTSNGNSYTIFLVARTRQATSDTGDHGILNLAMGSGDATEQGLRLTKSSVTCVSGSGRSSLSCTGRACTQCNSGQYTNLGQLGVKFGTTPTQDDNSCNATCHSNGGCDLENLPSACLTPLGPTEVQFLQDPDQWRIISIRAQQGTLEGFIDGFHSSSTPPLSVTGETAASVEQFRLGVVDTGDSSSPSYGSVDIAEILIYDDALTTQEMDRIGNYLATKFDLEYFRLDADVGSATRSAAVSKNCGCPTASWLAPNCNTANGPYCAAGAALASGTCTARGGDQNFKVITGNSFLDLPQGTGNSGPAAGQNQFRIQGYFLLPTDVNPEGPSGIFGANTTNNLIQIDAQGASDLDAAMTSRYLAVSVGRVPVDCRSPRSEVPCLPADFSEVFATDCRIRSFPATGTNDASTACASWVAPSPVPEIICTAPAGIGQGLDIVIYWHGIATVLSNWYHYEPPVIHSLQPNRVSYKGGAIVTVVGRNFGTAARWTATTAGGFQTANVQKAEIIIESRRPTKCRKTTWVSDSQLLCEVPPIPTTRQTMDTNARTVQVKVLVHAVNQRNSRTSASTLTYTEVPTYYACDNDKISSSSKQVASTLGNVVRCLYCRLSPRGAELPQRECFECCRSACIVDEFVGGASKKGFTYQFCDRSCYQYCGYISSRTRRLLSIEDKLRTRHVRLASQLIWGDPPATAVSEAKVVNSSLSA